MMGVAYAEFPKSLAFLTSLFTNEPFYKDEGREFNAKKDKAESFLTYNCKDAAITYEVKNAIDKELTEFGQIHKRDLKSFYYNYVNKLHDFYMDIEMEGLDVDVERRSELIKDYQNNIKSRQDSLNQLVGREFNVRSNPSIRKLLIDELGLPVRPNYQEDTIVALLGNHTESGSKESQVLSLILEIRQLGTNFNYLKAEYDSDGKIRTSYRITGTETGRTSTSVLKPPLRPIQAGLAFQTIPKHGPFSSAIRSIFIPPPGYVFLEADLSQAEARIVAILSDDSYTLHLFDTEDIHRVTSSWIFGINADDITSDQRFIGKVARHSGNYGTGKRTFMLSVNSLAKKFGLPIQISEKRAQEILDIFHTRTPKIRRVFQTEIKSQVGKDRTLFNPFGRMRQFFGNLKDEELYAQIPQSTVPDQIRMAGLRIKARIPRIRICAESHDALLFKVPEDKLHEYGKIIKDEFEVPIDFKHCSLSRGSLIIPADISVGPRYSELKKVKV
jgi:DNA polymerase-1